MAKGLRQSPRATAQPEPRAWQRMLSGRRLNLIEPSPFDIEIEDIAHGLARVARWNGQTIGEHAFSVAQHSIVVEDAAAHLAPGLSPKWRLAALLHDASEYVIGDMISPFKAALGLNYKAFEARLETAVHLSFGLPPTLPVEIKALIKRADRISAYYEAVKLAGFSVPEALELFGAPPEGLIVEVTPQIASVAQARYLERFQLLTDALTGGETDAAFSTE